MTDTEIREKLSNFNLKRNSIQDTIVALARGIAPALHDHQLHETAKPLDAALFELDAMQQDMVEFLKSDMSSILDAILPGRRPPS